MTLNLNFNPNAGGRYSWVHLITSNFIVNLSAFKMAPSSVSHLCKLRNHENYLNKFRKFISHERLIRILIWGANCLYFNSQAVGVRYCLGCRNGLVSPICAFFFYFLLDRVFFALDENKICCFWESKRWVWPISFEYIYSNCSFWINFVTFS